MDEEQQETTDNNLPRLNRPGSGRERPTNRTLNRLEETARRVYNFVDSQRSENREPSLAGGLARVFGDYRTTSRPAKKSKRVKGRPTEVVSIKVTCLSTNTTTRTSRLDINRLKRMGLGYPDGEITMTNRYPSKFPVTWTAEDLRDFFMNSFQALRGVEYDLLYAHNGIFYTIPDLVDTPVKIKQYFTELDKKTISIFIRPREDITARCMEVLSQRSTLSRAVEMTRPACSSGSASSDRSERTVLPSLPPIPSSSFHMANVLSQRSTLSRAVEVTRPACSSGSGLSGRTDLQRVVATAGSSSDMDDGLSGRTDLQRVVATAGSSSDMADVLSQRSTLSRAVEMTRPACSSGSDTGNLTRQQLIEIQDNEYLWSLYTDKKKEEIKKMEKEKKQREEDRREKKAEDLRKLILERRARLPEEPEDGVRLKFKTTTSWIDVTRNFARNTPLTVLQDFVGSLEGATEEFEVHFPNRRSITSRPELGSLENLEITTNTVVQVKWVEKNDEQTEDEPPMLPGQQSNVDEQIEDVVIINEDEPPMFQGQQSNADTPAVDVESLPDITTEDMEERSVEVAGPSSSNRNSRRRAAVNANNFIRGTCMSLEFSVL